MKKVFLTLALLAACVFSQPAMSAELQEGWYARYGVVLYYFTVPDVSWWIGGIHQINVGEYGPFTYTEEPSLITVTTGGTYTYADSLIIPIKIPDSPEENEYWTSWGKYGEFFSVSYKTNYDASQMNLQLWYESAEGEHSLLWTQNESGEQGKYGPEYSEIYFVDEPTVGSYYFKINVVPEPTGIIALVCGLSGLGMFGIRRRGFNRS